MPDLAAFQRRFAEALTDTGALHPLDGQPGFAVYRNNSARGVIDVLRDAYPTIVMLIGDARFDGVALDFFRQQPPSSPVLAVYGEGFADHLEDQPWIQDLPYLPEVARLDRLRLESHHAPDAPPLEPAALAGIDVSGWVELRLKLHPAARFAWLATPAMTIWLAHQEGEPPEDLTPDWREEGALFTRAADAVSATLIDRPQYRLLLGLRLGETIGEAATAVAATYSEADISLLFARLIASGALLALQERNG